MSLNIQANEIGKGVSWITDAFPYFSANPMGWIGSIIVLFIITAVVGIIPLGSLVLNIFFPVITGGYMLGCMSHKEGGTFEFQHMFAGFKEPYFKRLALVGVFYFAASLVVIILMLILAFILIGGFEFFQQLEQGQVEDFSQHTMKFVLITLIGVSLCLPLIMSIWFAPVIIVNRDESATSAMVMSFKACLKNILPLTLYGIVVVILSILAAIPLMLGFLVLLPVLSASVYVAYLDCFKLDIADEPTQLIT